MLIKSISYFFTLIIFISLIAGCAKKSEPPFDPKNMDLSVKPGDDFYTYTNGAWIKNNPIPDEYSRYGVFEQLLERNYTDLSDLFEDVSKGNTEKGTMAQKIGDFYATGMDTANIEQAGITPLNEELERINKIQNIFDVHEVIAHLHSYGISPLFEFFGYTDEKNSEMVITQLMQGGIGLPDRDYYVKEDPRSEDIRKEYVKHVSKMFQLMGEDSSKAQQIAGKIMEMETQLAKASMTLLERRDPHKTYNKMSLQKLQQMSRHFDWTTYFENIGLTEPGDINVRQPEFFKEVSKIMRGSNVDDWKNYLRWHVVDQMAAYLSSDFDNQNFHFFGTVLSGKKAQKPRWKRVLQTTSGAIGEGVGQLYVERYFPPAAKSRMLALVNNLKAALGERIQNLEWMGDETKKEALAKLEKMNVKIGYPDKWIDYSTLDIEPDAYVLNVLRARQFEFKRNRDKIGKPVDKDEWHMSPQTVNAYYSPTNNEIVFPAAILQPPFFNMAADDALNYGAIGMVIGHEMTHGFDDQGRNYDKNGNINDWWTKEDEQRFNERADVLVKQYNNFVAVDTFHVDGKLTLGENIADLGGLKIAYIAFQKSMEGKAKPGNIDGFTPEQRFFLSLAQVWRNNIRDKELIRRIKEDVHSPGRFRTNGPMANMPEFYAAFDVKEGDKLFIPEDQRATIW